MRSVVGLQFKFFWRSLGEVVYSNGRSAADIMMTNRYGKILEVPHHFVFHIRLPSSQCINHRILYKKVWVNYLLTLLLFSEQ